MCMGVISLVSIVVYLGGFLFFWGGGGCLEIFFNVLFGFAKLLLTFRAIPDSAVQ